MISPSHPALPDPNLPDPDFPPAANRGEEPTASAPRISAAPHSSLPTPESPEEIAAAHPPTALSPALQSALRDLVRQYEFECDSVRRQFVRRFREAEEFWRGNQNLYWGERDFRWHTPFENALERGSAAELPRYDYVTNLYQAFGLSVVAAISQRIPRVRFQPVSTLREEDIATARAAALVADLIERNNRIDLLTIRESYLLWTQGMFGAYVRYVVDEEFGTHPEPVYDLVWTQVLPDRYLCPHCGIETPASAATLQPLAPVAVSPDDPVALGASDAADNFAADLGSGSGDLDPGSNPGIQAPAPADWGFPSANSAPETLGSNAAAPSEPSAPAPFGDPARGSRLHALDSHLAASTTAQSSLWTPSVTTPSFFLPTAPAPPASAPLCAGCGSALGAAHFHPAEYLQVPVITGVQPVPNGQERISVYGGLNLKVMPYANELRESAYLILAEEQHAATLRAAYPALADQIGAGDPGPGDSYERLARLALVEPLGAPAGALPFTSLVTYKRCWLRPWAFWAHADADIRDQLLELFPQGCMVAFAGEVFLEARPEMLDDHWRLCRAMPGVGMYTEPVGASIISIQKRVNDLANIQAEHVEYGAAPPILYDARYINGQALANKRMEPASYTPVVVESAPGAKPLAEMIFQPRIGLDPSIYAQGQNLFETAQFLTGAFPAVFGGSMQDVTTATGYGMARDQALGRLSLFWRQIKQFHADLMLAAVNVFRKNRTQDVEQVLFQRSGDYASRFIRLGDLKGNITVHPEADVFPASWSEIRQNVLQLLQSPDPYIQNVLTNPLNADQVKQYIGVPGLVLPEEDNRSKQFREIDELLRGEPVFDSQRGYWLPTVPADPLVDDNSVHIRAIREWAVSDDGQHAKNLSPGGYANVMAHLLQHQRDLAPIPAVPPAPVPAVPADAQPAARAAVKSSH